MGSKQGLSPAAYGLQMSNVSEGSMQSMSTASTSDFFPTNPTDHSFGRFQAQSQSQSQSRNPSGDMKRIDSLSSIRTIGKSQQPSTPGQRLPSGGDGSHAAGAPPSSAGMGSNYPRATQMSGAATPLELSLSNIKPRISPVEARIASIKKHATTSTEKAVIHAIEIKPGAGPSSVFTVQQPVDRRISQHASFDSSEEKNDYFDGYRAGSAGDAPKQTRSTAYLNGFCDGLIKSRTGFSKRSLSTISLKSYENATPTQATKVKAPVDLRLPANRSDVSLNSLPKRSENVRTSSVSIRSTPYRALNPPTFISSPILASSRNSGFEQRVLSGTLHAYDIPSSPASDPLATSYVSVSNEAILKPQPRRHYELTNTNPRSVLTQRSSNTDDRVQFSHQWADPDQSSFRSDDYEGLKLKKPATNTKPRLPSGRAVSPSFDGTMEDLKEMMEPQHATSHPAEFAGNVKPSVRNKSSITTAGPSIADSTDHLIHMSPPHDDPLVTRIAASPDNDSAAPARCSPRRISPRKMAQNLLSIGSRSSRADADETIPLQRPSVDSSDARDHRGRSFMQAFGDDHHQQPKNPIPDPDARRGTKEKTAWVEKWKKNLNAIRSEEAREIKEYEKAHPLPK